MSSPDSTCTLGDVGERLRTLQSVRRDLLSHGVLLYVVLGESQGGSLTSFVNARDRLLDSASPDRRRAAEPTSAAVVRLLRLLSRRFADVDQFDSRAWFVGGAIGPRGRSVDDLVHCGGCADAEAATRGAVIGGAGTATAFGVSRGVAVDNQNEPVSKLGCWGAVCDTGICIRCKDVRGSGCVCAVSGSITLSRRRGVSRRRCQWRCNQAGCRNMPVAIENRIRRRVAEMDIVRKIGEQQLAERSVASPVRAATVFRGRRCAPRDPRAFRVARPAAHCARNR